MHQAQPKSRIARAIRRAYTFHQRLYAYWDARKSCEVQYNDIISSPERALIGIEEALQSKTTDDRRNEIIRELERLQGPKTGHYDPETLLHPNHRSSRGVSVDEKDLLNRIHKIILKGR